MTNGAIVVRARDLNGKLTITVDPKFAFRIQGTVTDDTGQPVSQAAVLLYWKLVYPRDGNQGSGWSNSLKERLLTDGSGRFVSSPLWAGDEYNLIISADGFNRLNTPPVIGQPGMVRRPGLDQAGRHPRSRCRQGR